MNYEQAVLCTLPVMGRTFTTVDGVRMEWMRDGFSDEWGYAQTP